MRLKQTVVCPLLCGSAVLIAASPANAAFIEDSKASVDLRNFYMNRDFRSGDGQSKAEEWAQGFMLKMESGYTEGPTRLRARRHRPARREARLQPRPRRHRHSAERSRGAQPRSG